MRFGLGFTAVTTIVFVTMSGLAVASDGATTSPQSGDKPTLREDLARVERWRPFLDRAHRAFTAAHMSTTEVKEKITEADQRIERLRELIDEHGGDAETIGADITADVPFLERAHRAFTAAHMSTTDVQRWLAEAKERSGGAS